MPRISKSFSSFLMEIIGLNMPISDKKGKIDIINWEIIYEGEYPTPIESSETISHIIRSGIDGPKVEITHHALNCILGHANHIEGYENAGMLLGHLAQLENNQLLIKIEEIVTAEYAETESHIGEKTYWRFSPEAWMKGYLRDFPNMMIVGWYHSHPNAGIVLCGMDIMFRIWFNAPWHIAIVIDPAQYQVGFFINFGGKRFSPEIFSWTEDIRFIRKSKNVTNNRL